MFRGKIERDWRTRGDGAFYWKELMPGVHQFLELKGKIHRNHSVADKKVCLKSMGKRNKPPRDHLTTPGSGSTLQFVILGMQHIFCILYNFSGSKGLH